MEEMMKTKTKAMALAASSMGMTLVIFVMAAFIFGFFPFPGKDFVFFDARIQYVDIFAWLQRLVRGEDSMAWSFFRGMGGNVWPIFSYYLSSPLNLLVMFFRREELYVAYHIVALAKLCLSAAMMAIYLCARFENRISPVVTVLLAVSYALSAYGIFQLFNVMWLDGFVMLPWILLGVWLAGTQKKPFCLIASSCVALFCNWYTGFIDLAFASFFALWEGWRACGDAFRIREYIAFLGRTAVGIILGVGLSAILVIPTMEGLAGGRAGIDWNALDFSYQGDLRTFLTGQMWGRHSEKGEAVLFVGAFAFLNAFACFWNPGISKRWRLRALVIPIFLVLAFYWHPLSFLFSLLKETQGYPYRYSSIGIFLLIYLAGWNASLLPDLKHLGRMQKVAFSAFMPIGFFCACFYERFLTSASESEKTAILPEGDMAVSLVIAAAAIYFAMAVILLFFLECRSSRKAWALAALIGLSMLDLGGNLGSLVKHAWLPASVASEYSAYVNGQEAQFQALRELDPGLYRVSQTSTFNVMDGGVMANYNEGLAAGMMTLSSYTSSPNNDQMSFLHRFGYRQNGPNMNIVNTSFLGTDSLLGVKYVLADRPIQGLQRVETISEEDGKAIYENPFAFPLAFACESIDFSGLPEEDPFLCVNEAYTRLFHRPMQVCVSVPFTIGASGPTSQRYEVATPWDGQLYGEIRGEGEDSSSRISIDENEEKGYRCWLAPSVFDITEDGREKHDIFLSSLHPLPELHPHFYRIDEDVLREAASLARSRAADVTLGKNMAVFRVEGREGEKLFTSLPWDKGWHVMQNGHSVSPERISGTLMGFTLEEGENEITMQYVLPGWKKGMAVSLLAFIFCIFWCRRERRCQRARYE